MRIFTPLVLAMLLPQAVLAAQSKGVDWQPYGAKAFEQARQEHRLVLLDLVAVWCHWCHVMDDKTYANPEVQRLIAKHYVAVRADHDAHPNLAARYRDYGWPATVIFKPDGTALAKRAGYIPPRPFSRLLTETYAQRHTTVFKPTATTRGKATQLTDRWRKNLLQRYHDTYDPQTGALKQIQKFLDADTLDYDLRLAANGDKQAAARARKTLAGAAKLVDPAFGGAYQYSVNGDWDHPHFEKIASVQANYLRVYSRAYQQFGDPAYRHVIEKVAGYVIKYWQSPSGGFYNSQDADLINGQQASAYFALPLKQRLAKGMPHIDKHRYTSSNGLLIQGLLDAYLATGNKTYLDSGVKAFSWVMRHRLREDGGFAHSAKDQRSYLADDLYMARAMLAVYRVSGQQRWLKQAQHLVTYMDNHFSDPKGGMRSGEYHGVPPEPVPQIDENIQAARFLIKMALLEKPAASYPYIANVMRYLVNPPTVNSRSTDPGILIANAQWNKLLARHKASGQAANQGASE